MNTKINERIINIIKQFKLNKYSTAEEELLSGIFHKILLNEKTTDNKNKLLDVIEMTNSYNYIDINNYVISIIQEIVGKNSDSYIVYKQKIDGSNNCIVSNLSNFGYFDENHIIKYKKTDEIVELEYKELSDKAVIVIVDDYVGSGKSIIDILKAIEKEYIGKKILIISYIWQEKAINKVEEYINESEKLNSYEIYKNNIIKENTYYEKFYDNQQVLKYIKKYVILAKIQNLDLDIKIQVQC